MITKQDAASGVGAVKCKQTNVLQLYESCLTGLQNPTLFYAFRVDSYKNVLLNGQWLNHQTEMPNFKYSMGSFLTFQMAVCTTVPSKFKQKSILGSVSILQAQS